LTKVLRRLIIPHRKAEPGSWNLRPRASDLWTHARS
jgi:hypothetical protein